MRAALVLLVLTVVAGSALLAAAGADAEAPTREPPHAVRLTAAPAISDCPPAPAPCGPGDGITPALDALYEYLAAVAHAAWLDSIMHDHWLRIGRCEQPGSGYGGIEWTVDGVFGNGLAGGGGLGISNGAWSEAGGQQYAPRPGGASPFQQMEVATRIYQRHGPGAWGCG